MARTTDAGTGGVVIVGAGQAGLSCALALRRGGWSGGVSLIGDEPHPPYERPPLSKKLLVSAVDPGALVLADADSLSTAGIDYLRGHVVGLERDARVVELGDGRRLGYHHLVLATGASPRHLPTSIPGADARGVEVIRTLDDGLAVAGLLQDTTEVVVLGGGFIGVETAAAIAATGRRVTLLEMLDSLLARVVPTQLGEWVTRHLASLGVEVCTATTVAAVETDVVGRVDAVIDSHGSRHPAQLVVLGLGAVPSVSLAEEAGLDTDGGVVVDDRLQTTDPDISAIGDCAVQLRSDGSRHRHESVQAAQDQGSYVARRLLGGSQDPYAEVPWFWSDIADVSLQMAGRIDLAEQVITRGDPGSGRFALFGYGGGTFVGVAAVNSPRDYLAGRMLLRTGRPLPVEVVGDETVDLRSFARAK